MTSLPRPVPATSAAAGTAPRPSNWDKRVSAAYLRIMGATQKRAAKSVGVSERTVWTWEQHASWADARAEARVRWLDEAADTARGALLRGLQNDDQASARWLLERVDAALSGPVQRHELTGKDGAPIAIDLEDLRDRLTRRLVRLVATN